MSDEELLVTFDKLFLGYIKNDIETAISGGANYLAALGIFSYIEFLGGLLTGNSGIEGESKNNFNEAIKLFSYEYQELNNELEVTDTEGKSHKGIYGIVRCGLVHEYIIKGGAVIHNAPLGPIQDHTGITYTEINGRKMIALFNNEFFRDFRTVIDGVSERLHRKEELLFENVKKSMIRLGSRTQVSVSPSSSVTSVVDDSEWPVQISKKAARNEKIGF